MRSAIDGIAGKSEVVLSGIELASLVIAMREMAVLNMQVALSSANWAENGVDGKDIESIAELRNSIVNSLDDLLISVRSRVGSDNGE